VVFAFWVMAWLIPVKPRASRIDVVSVISIAPVHSLPVSTSALTVPDATAEP
jgi:hypothetical protein